MISLPQSRADAYLERGWAGGDAAGSDRLQAVSGAWSPLSPSRSDAAAQSALGTTAKLRAARYERQGLARVLLPLERVARCLCSPISAVQVLQVAGRELGVLKGLQTCGSVWICGVCGAKISERRRVELQEGIDAAVDLGLDLALVTFTTRHHLGQSLREMRRGLQRARERMARSRGYRKLMDELSVGSVRALEVTFGLNGWHPHMHELRFLKKGVDLVAFGDALRVMWLAALDAEGLSGNGHALTVVAADASGGDYLVKLDGSASWTAAHELTKQVVKKGRHGSRSPVDLLDAYGAGDVEAGQLWVEYAREMKGCHQLVWSRGLRALLGLGVEMSDDEVAAQVEETGAVVVHSFTTEEWATVRSNDVRYEVLVLAGQGDGEGIRRLLRDLGG